jgi:hypothetical protein
MYLMYVDESGDAGRTSPVRHFILSALVVPVVDWQESFDRHHQMRRYLRATYGYPVRAELHAAALVDTRRGNDNVRQLGGRRTRMLLYRDVMRWIPDIFPTGRTFSVYVDKDAAETSSYQHDNYFELAWNYLITRYHNYLTRDCDGAPGLVFSDDTANATVRALLRRMRVYNPIPSYYDRRGYYNVPARTIIEDPVFRRSQHSYFVQMADMIAHSLYRKLYVKGSYRRYNLHLFYDYLDSILLKSVSKRDPLNMGIVWIPPVNRQQKSPLHSGHWARPLQSLGLVKSRINIIPYICSFVKAFTEIHVVFGCFVPFFIRSVIVSGKTKHSLV